MRNSKIKTFLIISVGTILMTFVTTVAAPHLEDLFQDYSILATYILLALLVAGLVLYLKDIGKRKYEAMKKVRYANLIYFLNKKNELLLVLHPFHKVRIPPGGRLDNNELAHKAVSQKLEEEAGIKADEFEFHPAFHKQLIKFGLVEDVPEPFAIQLEHRTQKGNIKKHYSFVYVCKFKNGKERELDKSMLYRPEWFALEDMKNMNEARPFDDVFLRYENMLCKVATNGK